MKEDEKTLLYLIIVFVLIIALVMVTIYAYRLFAGEKSELEIGYEIYKDSQEVVENAVSTMSNQELKAFNANWTNYEGVQTSPQVKSLKMKVERNNETYSDDPDHQIELIIKDEIKNNNKYNVKLFYSDVGYVNKIEVENNKTNETSLKIPDESEVSNKINKQAIEEFNYEWKIFEGNKSGIQVDILKNALERHNSTFSNDPDSQIELIIKDEIKNDNKYNIELFYNNEGYVNKIEVKLEQN